MQSFESSLLTCERTEGDGRIVNRLLRTARDAQRVSSAESTGENNDGSDDASTDERVRADGFL